MAETKHTPGEWTIKGPSRGLRDFDDGGDYAIVVDGNQIIAEVIRRTDTETYQPAFANAHLIAAAPTMLEALEQINEFACYTQENQDARDDMLLNIGNAARAAIAKATGDSQ